MPLFKKQKIVLALGGGAARGLATIGVLKILERERVPIDMIVGTSIGGFVGAAYSIGVPIYKMEKAALKFSVDKLVDFSVSKWSLLRGKKLEKLIDDFIDKKDFSDARIPFAITTTDIETGDEVVHTKGDLQKIIKASCSWPGIFPPVIIDGKKLSDGGIRNSIPVKTAKKLGATKVIAVDIGFCAKKGKLDNLFQLFIQSIQILGEELDAYQVKQADVTISPRLHNLDQLAFDRIKEIMQDGETAAKKAMPVIRKLLGVKPKIWKF